MSRRLRLLTWVVSGDDDDGDDDDDDEDDCGTSSNGRRLKYLVEWKLLFIT